MGSEDLFHKRKARKLEDAARTLNKRKPYDRVLIVSEGEKTEPIYFEELRVFYDLDSANIVVDGDSDSSPISVVEYAYELYLKDKKSGDLYNRVYCVFDRDTHASYFDAFSRIDEINRLIDSDVENKVFRGIFSNPAFEFWYLLHFSYTDKPYYNNVKDSVGKQVENDLKFFFPDYQKNKPGIFKYLNENGNMQYASANAKRILDNSKNNEYNPSTNVFKLTEYLSKLKD